MKITESEFREIIRQKIIASKTSLKESLALGDEFSGRVKDSRYKVSKLAQNIDDVEMEVISYPEDTAIGKKFKLRDISNRANHPLYKAVKEIHDDPVENVEFEPSEGEQKDASGNIVAASAERPEDSEEATGAEEQEPAAEKTPEASTDAEGEADETSGIGDAERIKIEAYRVNYADSDEEAFKIRLPLEYMKFTPGGKKAGIFRPKTLQRIQKSSRLPAEQKNFVVRFGAYPGMPEGSSLFGRDNLNIDDIRSFSVRGPDLDVGQIKRTELGKIYDVISDLRDIIDDNRDLIKRDSEFEKFFRRIATIDAEMKKGEYDILQIRQRGKNINRARFSRNREPESGIRADVDRIWIANEKSPIIDDIRSKIKNARKGNEELGNDAVLAKLSNAEEPEQEAVVSESSTPEREIAKILKSLVSSEIKKKRLGELLARDSVSYDSRTPGVDVTLPPGRTSLAGTALVATGAGAIWQDISGGKDIVFSDGSGDDFRRPLGIASTTITSRAQPHRIIGGGSSKPHTGVDLSTGGNNVPVLSIAAGTVARAEVLDAGCGNGVVISHGGQVIGGEYRLNASVYCHLSSINVAKDQAVSAGDLIGMSGGGENDPNPGRSTARHLHFAIRVSDDNGSVSTTIMEPYGAFFGEVAGSLKQDEEGTEGEEVEINFDDMDSLEAEVSASQRQDDDNSTPDPEPVKDPNYPTMGTF